MTASRWFLASSLVFALSACPSSGDDTAETTTETTTESGETEGCVLTNACGTYNLCEAGDGVIPEVPDTPAIVEACTAYCAAIEGIGGCTVELDACVSGCSSDACGICPGTLAPLVDCRTQQLEPADCTCTDGVVECPSPAACEELDDATYQCGG